MTPNKMLEDINSDEIEGDYRRRTKYRNIKKLAVAAGTALLIGAALA